jgi:hypothetical protein
LSFSACAALWPVVIVFPLAIASVQLLWFNDDRLLVFAGLITGGIIATVWLGVGEGIFYVTGLALPSLALAFSQKRDWSLLRALALVMVLPVAAVTVFSGTLDQFMNLLEYEMMNLMAQSSFNGTGGVYGSQQLQAHVQKALGAITSVLPSLLAILADS